MANEISLAVSLSVSKSGALLSKSFSRQYTMAGDDLGQGTQLIGFAADEQLVLPADIGTGKILIIENLDTTNFVNFSYATGGSFVSLARIDPSGILVIRPTSLTIYLQADTADCRVAWALVEA